ncbi:hypothetical protein [Streptomyces tubercidicus]|uniref:hypothetical protein n=1 Tax=Streptomyces tubercidicus TaxID=47759 RepID=UPI0036B68A44
MFEHGPVNRSSAAPTLARLEGDLGALEVDFTAAQRVRLGEAGAMGFGSPHDKFAGNHIRRVTAGDLKIERCH